MGSKEKRATVSLICTVRNEADNIAALLDSMLAQSRLPDEIIINDCGSQDETAAIVRSYAEREPRVHLVAGGYNISSGRNNAIAAAAGSLIACTDAGLTLDRDWLAHIVGPLEAGSADLVGGFFRAAPQSLFELVLAATNYRAPEEIDPQRFLPFGKSMAFRKTVWEEVGGFPEWVDHCEDLVFDRAIERAGHRRSFVPDALVYFRPRESLRAFAQQYIRYARGDGAAGLWPQRHLTRYATYATLLVLLLVGWRCPSSRLLVGGALLSGATIYTRAPYRRLWPHLHTIPWKSRLRALALVPLIRLVGDCAKMIGYPQGVRKRTHTRTSSTHDHAVRAK